MCRPRTNASMIAVGSYSFHTLQNIYVTRKTVLYLMEKWQGQSQQEDKGGLYDHSCLCLLRKLYPIQQHTKWRQNKTRLPEGETEDGTSTNECSTQKTQESKVNSSGCKKHQHTDKIQRECSRAFPCVSNNSFKNIVEKHFTEDSNSMENAGR